MERLYPVLDDIWHDAHGDFIDVEDKDLKLIIAMINRAYDRGFNKGCDYVKNVTVAL
jgi:hypothetical protein